MSDKPRKKHLSKIHIKQDGKYYKKDKPWKKQREDDPFINVTMHDIYSGFKNKHISIRDAQYRERMG